MTTFCELTKKEVINCNDGSRLGNVADIELSVEECRIIALIVKNASGLFSKNDEIRIPVENIEKIGSDVIIVNYKTNSITDCDCQLSPQKRRFLF